ncbi:hypothetical protein FF011L_45790 [Roseimaritima multifibrata]|uniref:DUF3352 domain-containing protein n=1 Tax=Roseimaritima multifibrata TaxID=1930274 RepID=A0A517MLL4_9BACT|nr:hypothetical protein FF011L_45790 [Roseimaritima multifibrata]
MLSYLLRAVLLSAVTLVGSIASAQPVNPADGAPFPSAVQWLPETTGGYLRAINMPALRVAWDKTTISHLRTDPAMKPFWDAQQKRAEQDLMAAGMKVGLNMNDLFDISSGEVVFAWMTYPDPKRPYTVGLVSDIRGRIPQTDAALATLDQNMQHRNATRKDISHRGQTIRLYTLPKAPGQLKIDHIAVTYNSDRLIAADREATVKQLLDAAAGAPIGPELVAAADHQEIWDQVGDSDPAEVRWFARPLPFARILRELAETDRGQQVDIVNLLERQGFAAVLSAGGRVQVATGEYDLLHQGYIHAPKPENSKDRFELAARMLDFPNQPPAPLPNWIDSEASTSVRLNWKMEDAFWAAESLVDDAFGSEIFRPTLKGILEDPEGPQIDIPNNIIANFNNHLYHVTDHVHTESDRTLVAIELKNADVVAAAVNKAMESEPDASRLPEPAAHPIWKVVPQAAPDFGEGEFGDFGFESDFGPVEEEERAPPLLEQWAITVIKDPSLENPNGGYLFFSSHASQLVDTVQRILDGTSGEFENQADVKRINQHLISLGGEERSLSRINRTRKAWRVKYELLRTGKLRDSDSILGNLIRRSEKQRQGKTKHEPLDTSSLPPFEQIEQFLQPAGSLMQTESGGWRLRGFLLK